MSVTHLALETLKELLRYRFIFLPSFLVFHWESLISLKTWTVGHTLQYCGPDDMSDNVNHHGPPPRNAYREPIHSGSIFVHDLSILIAAFVGPFLNGVQLKVFNLIVLLWPFTAVVLKATGILSGSYQRTIVLAHSYKMSHYISEGPRPPFVCELLLLLLPPFFSTTAILFNIPEATLIVFLGILHDLTDRILLLAIPLSKFRHFFLLSNGSLLLMIFCFSIHSNTPADKHGTVQWVYIFLSALSLLLPFHILSMLLRFDYANSPPVNVRPIAYEEYAAFHLNYRKPAFFPHQYYTMGFMVFGASFIALAMLSALGVASFRIEAVGIWAACLSAPGMTYGALVVAAVKGQWKRLWAFDYWSPMCQRP